MSESGLHVAAIQPFVPGLAREIAAMQRIAWKSVREAAGRGARLIVLPEYFNAMGLAPNQVREESKNTGEQRNLAAEICRKYKVWLLLPLIESRNNGVFNTAHLFNPSGEIAFTYDKTHLTISERRDYELTPGNTIETFDTELGCIGVMICYDIYFPEVARVLALKGAQIILFPSLQRSDTEDRCMLLNRTRAVDSTAYLIRSSYGQKKEGIYKPGLMYGASCIVSPDGSVLANAGHHEGMAEAEIYPQIPWRRQRCGSMPPQVVRDFLNEDRRPELYSEL